MQQQTAHQQSALVNLKDDSEVKYLRIEVPSRVRKDISRERGRTGHMSFLAAHNPIFNVSFNIFSRLSAFTSTLTHNILLYYKYLPYDVSMATSYLPPQPYPHVSSTTAVITHAIWDEVQLLYVGPSLVVYSPENELRCCSAAYAQERGCLVSCQGNI